MDKEALVAAALEKFPRWMEASKKKAASKTGELVTIIAGELDAVAQEVSTQKDRHFLWRWLGKEDTVVDYLYMVNIGATDGDIIVSTPSLPVVVTTSEFYPVREEAALWQDGYLFIPVSKVPNDGKISWSINGISYGATGEKIHIWNIFDEFALFAGMERFEDEKNEDLVQRILYSLLHASGGSVDGLKQAIINAMQQTDPVKAEEIDISITDSEATEKGFYESLASVDQDVSRHKKWDISRWEHPFSSLRWLPHQWDVQPKSYQDGVGGLDDVKVVLTSDRSDLDKTDVDIYAYERSEVEISEYVRKNAISADIELGLSKYSNELEPIDVEFRIRASEAVDITTQAGYVDCCRSREGESYHWLEDLIMEESAAAPYKTERNRLSSNSKYKLEFRSKSEYGSMRIDKAMLNVGGTKTSLLKTSGSFVLQADNSLVNVDVKKQVESISDLDGFENLKDIAGGMTPSDATMSASMLINLSGCEGKYFNMDVSCRETPCANRSDMLTLTGFVLSNGQYVSQGTDNDNVILELDASYITMETTEGSCQISHYINGSLSSTSTWNLPKKAVFGDGTSKKHKLVVRRLGLDQMTIRTLSYSDYDVILKLDSGSLVQTAMGKILPKIDGNKMRITINCRSSFAPVIKYIHIGANLKNAIYATEEFTTGSDGGTLDISSNCSVKLIKISGTTQTTTDDYITKPLYRNTTQDTVYLKIDLSGFSDIKSSTPAISSFSSGNSTASYVTLLPGESYDRLVVNGKTLSLQKRVYIVDLLLQDKPAGSKVYSSRMMPGFIVKSGTDESFVMLSRDTLDSSSDSFRSGGWISLSSAWLLDSGTQAEVVGSSCSGGFIGFYLYPSAGKEYVSYQKYRTVLPESSGITLSDTMSPLPASGALLCYKVDPSDDWTVTFDNTEDGTWSLGKTTVTIKLGVDLAGANAYQMEKITLQQKFRLANLMEIDRSISTSGREIDIAQWIVMAPQGMKIIYDLGVEQETIIAEEDGFNKLWFSNIKGITLISGASVNDYQLLNTEGIIVWNDPKAMKGKSVTVTYIYNVPAWITFETLDGLYEKIGYKIDAYKIKTGYPHTIHGATDGTDVYDAGLLECDRSIAVCSLPNWQARIDEGHVIVKRIQSGDGIAVHDGYFYQDGKEYYQYHNLKSEEVSRLKNVTLENVKRLDNELMFHQAAMNYLPDSYMKRSRLDLSCYALLSNVNVTEGISFIKAVGACENVNYWNTFQMSVAYKTGRNGLAIEFVPQKEFAYAILDISRYCASGRKVSIYAGDGIKIRFAKEVMLEDMPFTRSLLCEPMEEITKNQQGYLSASIPEESVKMFLLVTGSGIVDDIVICDESEDEESIHTKWTERYGISFDEVPAPGTLLSVPFDPLHNELYHLDVTEDGLLRTGSSVDWGLTKLYDASTNWSAVTVQGGWLIKDHLESTSSGMTVYSQVFQTSGGQSAKRFVVKINELLESPMKRFHIALQTADSASGPFRTIAERDDANVLTAIGSRMGSYGRIKVEAKSGRVINNIEAYAEYAQTTSPLWVSEYKSGYLTTKIHDAGSISNWRINRWIAREVVKPEKIGLQVRGLKESTSNYIFSDWKDCLLDSGGNVISDIRLSGYRYMQFRIKLDSPEASAKPMAFEMEAL